MFSPELTRCALKQRAEDAWSEATDALGLDLAYYAATRHPFVSRALAAGAATNEVSAAVGHASVQTTERHYAHFIRKTYSPTLRAGLASSPKAQATVTPISQANGK